MQRPREVERNLVCVTYVNRSQRMSSTWMGSQSLNRSKGSRYHNPENGEINVRKQRKRMWCSAIGCHKIIDCFEDKVTGNLEFKHSGQRTHLCTIPVAHRDHMRFWWETRLWNNIEYVVKKCPECNCVSQTKKYGPSLNAPIVYIGKHVMFLKCEVFKVVIAIRFDNIRGETIPIPQGYYTMEFENYQDIPPIEQHGKMIKYDFPCVTCRQLLKLPVSLTLAKCPKCGLSHDTVYMTTCTQRLKHRLVFNINGARHYVVANRGRARKIIEPRVHVWLAPRKPEIYPVRVRGTPVRKRCLKCTPKKPLPVMKDPSYDVSMFANRAALLGNVEEDESAYDIVRQMNTGFTINGPPVVCYGCKYVLPQKLATWLPEIPSKQHFGYWNAPINIEEGFYFCPQCMGTCQFCDKPALAYGGTTECTTCERQKREGAQSRGYRNRRGRVLETTLLY